MSIAQRNTTVVTIAQFCNALIFTIPIWIVYYQGAGITIPQISFFVALQQIIQIVLELPTGALADIIGRKKTIVLGYLGSALSSLILITHPSFTTIFLSILLVGLSEALISGSLEAILYDSHKQEGKEDQFRASLSHSSFWFQIGLAIGTFGGGFLYQIWNGLPFLLYGLTALISTVASFFLLEPTIDSETFTIKGYFRQIVDGTKHAFSGDLARTVSLFYILVGGVTWANQLYFNSFMLIELGFSDVTRGIIGAVFRIVNIFILGALLRNEKIFTRTRSILFFPIMMMLCFLPGITFQGVFALPFVAGALMTGTARWIVLAKYTNEMFDSRYRATAISALSMFIGLIVTAITLAAGPVIEQFGVRTMYTILGVLGVTLVLPLGLHLRAKLKTNERIA